MSRLLIAVNSAWNVANFRAGLVRALVADGHEVIAAVDDDGALARVEALGARTIVLPMASHGVSVLGDLALFVRFLRVLRRERPDLYLGWTIKPNTYGSFAAALVGIPAINNISGLGTAFIRRGWLTFVAKRLYRLGLRKSATVFFQNEDDRALFIAHRLVRHEQAALLAGSGIDTTHFQPRPKPGGEDGLFRFLLVGRLLRDKGLREYAAAARAVQAAYPHVRFQILGALDARNRAAIDRRMLDKWVAAGWVDYLGHADDVRPFIAAADCVVLPSYREGTPRALLEAAAMARPLIATDVPGCRDVVADGRTGLLCRVRDAADLADKMRQMVAMPPDIRKQFGRSAQANVNTRFSETSVIQAYLQAIDKNTDRTKCS
jgi:glycosyltransferase involved in cell wall biosynthesis